MASARAVGNAVTGLFLVSGACGLVYEVAWSRLLVLRLGNTTTANAVVLGTFMGGLAIGYALLGRLAHRVARPVAAYGAIELAVAAWTAASPALLGALDASWLGVARAAGPAAAVAARVALAAAVLLVPTALMGATLPLLVRAFAPQPERAGSEVARLYSANSAGAFVGTLLAGLWLVPTLGPARTLTVVAGVNAAAGFAALLLGRRGASAAGEGPAPPLVVPSDAAARVALVAAGVIGAASLLLETVWIRLLGVILGSATTSFTATVAAFIAGIALGGALARRLLGRRPPTLGLLAVVAGLAALAVAVVSPAFGRMSWELARLKALLAPTDAAWPLYEGLKLLLALAVMVPAATLLGALLPIAAGIEAARLGVSERGAGRAFSINTVGAVVGAVVAGPLVVPWLGLGGALRAGGVLLGLVALVTAARSGRRGVAIAVAGLAAAALIPHGWDLRVLTAGEFRTRRSVPATWDAYVARAAREEVLHHVDGRDVSVTVVERHGERSLRINGKTDASDGSDMLTQVACAHLPLLLARDPADVLIVGFGSGATAGSARLHGVEVDVVEIAQEVVDAGRFFAEANHEVLDDPGVRIHVDDARTFLLLSERSWDVIVSEPSNPWVAGNAALFTREYFEQARAHLRPGGVFAQWLHLYEMDDDLARLIVRTFTSVFPELTVWELYPNDLLLVASIDGAAPDLDSLLARAAAPPIAADLARVGLAGPVALLGRQMLSSGVARHAAGEGALHTDEQPTLEVAAPRALFRRARATWPRELDERARPPAAGGLLLGRLLATRPLAVSEAEALFVLETRFPSAPRSFRRSLIPLLVARSEPAFLRELLFTLVGEGELDGASPVAARLLALTPDDPEALLPVCRHRAALLARRASVLAEPDDTELRALLARCIVAGDDHRGRCGELLSTLPPLR